MSAAVTLVLFLSVETGVLQPSAPRALPDFQMIYPSRHSASRLGASTCPRVYHETSSTAPIRGRIFSLHSFRIRLACL